MYQTPGTIEEVYYAVPTFYGIGEKFTTAQHKEAVAHARSTIETFEYGEAETRHSRAFVDRREVVRWADGMEEDRVVQRTEVFLKAPSKVVAA